jgi:hypothetical protein
LAGEHLDMPPAKPGGLAPPQATVSKHEDQRPVTDVDGVGQVLDLVGGQELHLVTDRPGHLHRGAGVPHQDVHLGGATDDHPEHAVALEHRRCGALLQVLG